MSRKIKRFFVFFLFSLVFSLLAGRINHSDNSGSGDKKEASDGWNSAWAGVCCEIGICDRPDGTRYCCK